MNAPPRPLTGLPVDFHRYFRCSWGRLRPRDSALNADRRAGRISLAQYAVLRCDPPNPAAAERTGQLAVVFDPAFAEWLGERRNAVYRRVEQVLAPLTDGQFRAGRQTLVVAATSVNKVLNDLYANGTLWGSLPELPD